MINYIEENLANGETIIRYGSISIFSFMARLGIAAASITGALLVKAYHLDYVLYGVFVCEILMIFLIIATTEMAVTNLKVASKYGILRIDAVSVSMDRIEMIHIKQSLWQRIFNYGTVVITGTGSNPVIFKHVSNPQGLKKIAEEAQTRFRNGLSFAVS